MLSSGESSEDVELKSDAYDKWMSVVQHVPLNSPEFLSALRTVGTAPHYLLLVFVRVYEAHPHKRALVDREPDLVSFLFDGNLPLRVFRNAVTFYGARASGGSQVDKAVFSGVACFERFPKWKSGEHGSPGTATATPILIDDAVTMSASSPLSTLWSELRKQNGVFRNLQFGSQALTAYRKRRRAAVPACTKRLLEVLYLWKRLTAYEQQHVVSDDVRNVMVGLRRQERELRAFAEESRVSDTALSCDGGTDVCECFVMRGVARAQSGWISMHAVLPPDHEHPLRYQLEKADMLFTLSYATVRQAAELLVPETTTSASELGGSPPPLVRLAAYRLDVVATRNHVLKTFEEVVPLLHPYLLAACSLVLANYKPHRVVERTLRECHTISRALPDDELYALVQAQPSKRCIVDVVASRVLRFPLASSEQLKQTAYVVFSILNYVHMLDAIHAHHERLSESRSNISIRMPSLAVMSRGPQQLQQPSDTQHTGTRPQRRPVISSAITTLLRSVSQTIAPLTQEDVSDSDETLNE